VICEIHASFSSFSKNTLLSEVIIKADNKHEIYTTIIIINSISGMDLYSVRCAYYSIQAAVD